MQVSQHLRAYLGGCELANDRESHGPPELIEFLVLEASPPRRAKAAFGELHGIALAQAPGVEGRLRDQYPEGISDAAQRDFHPHIITCYYVIGNDGSCEAPETAGKARGLSAYRQMPDGSCTPAFCACAQNAATRVFFRSLQASSCVPSLACMPA